MVLRIFERIKRSFEVSQAEEVECRRREIFRLESQATHWVVMSFNGANAYVEIVGVSTTSSKECGDFELKVVDGTVCLSFEGRNKQSVEIGLTLEHEMGFACPSHADASHHPLVYTFCAFLTRDKAKSHAARRIPVPPPSRTGAGS